MDLTEIEREAARLDALVAPLADAAVVDPAWTSALVGLGEEAQPVLRAVVDRYAAGAEATRAELRGLFGRHPAFRWVAALPAEWHGAAESSAVDRYGMGSMRDVILRYGR